MVVESIVLMGRTIVDGLQFDTGQFKLEARHCQFCKGALRVSEVMEFDEDGFHQHEDVQQRDFQSIVQGHLEFTFEGI